MTLEALEISRKSDDFSGYLQHPQVLKALCEDARPLISMLYYKKSRMPETDSRGPESETGSLDTEPRAHGIHDTLDLGHPCPIFNDVGPLGKRWAPLLRGGFTRAYICVP